MLSTLHTNDAPSSINRLVNMGIEPFLVANSINLIAAQRLVRRVCENCKEPHRDFGGAAARGRPAAESELPKVKAMKGRGCDRCSGTGYKGRLGLFEIMEVSDVDARPDRRERARSRTSRTRRSRKACRRCAEAGMLKVRDGVTTIEEVARETM